MELIHSTWLLTPVPPVSMEKEGADDDDEVNILLGVEDILAVSVVASCFVEVTCTAKNSSNLKGIFL